MSLEQLNKNPEAEVIKSADEEKYQLFLADLEKAGLRFEPTRKFKLGEINYDYFTNISPEDLQEMKQIFTWLREFLEMPYQLDDFGTDHGARRAWEKDIETKYDKDFEALIGRSKLSSGTLTGIRYSIDMFVGSILPKLKSPEFKEFAEKVKQMWEGFYFKVFNGYDEFSIVEKKKKVEILEDKVYEILKLAEEVTIKE